MLRKFLLAFAATAMLGATALTPTVAAAHGYHRGYHHHYGHYWWGHRYWHRYGFYVGGGDCFYTWRGILVCPGY